MIKIGLTGGIGSGKSIVASLFKLEGIPVYIADEESKLLTVQSPVIRHQLIELFGEHIYTPEGINRKRLAELIFTNKENLAKVNQIIHPEVGRHFLAWVEKQKSDLCVMESAILFESIAHTWVDKTVTVYAPEELRIQRIINRDHTSIEEIRHRMSNQLADKIKKERSDYVIINDDRSALIPQVEAVLNRIRLSEKK